MNIDRKQIENLVRDKLLATLQTQGAQPPLAPTVEPSGRTDASQQVFDFVNEEIVRQYGKEQTIVLTPRAIVTPSAQDMADQAGIRFQVQLGNAQSGAENFSPQAIALGADHGGFPLKEAIKKQLQQSGYHIVDMGTHNAEAVDYPDFAYSVATAVAKGECKRGIMIDGAGIGSAMVANKVPGIRAANCHNLFEVKNSREHNDANILTLGGRVIGDALAAEMVRLWLETPFAGGRHQQRVDKIIQYERIGR